MGRVLWIVSGLNCSLLLGDTSQFGRNSNPPFLTHIRQIGSFPANLGFKKKKHKTSTKHLPWIQGAAGKVKNQRLNIKAKRLRKGQKNQPVREKLWVRRWVLVGCCLIGSYVFWRCKCLGTDFLGGFRGGIGPFLEIYAALFLPLLGGVDPPMCMCMCVYVWFVISLHFPTSTYENPAGNGSWRYLGAWIAWIMMIV